MATFHDYEDKDGRIRVKYGNYELVKFLPSASYYKLCAYVLCARFENEIDAIDLANEVAFYMGFKTCTPNHDLKSEIVNLLEMAIRNMAFNKPQMNDAG